MEEARKIAEYERQMEANAEASQRKIAEELAVARSTLQHWLARKGRIDASPELVAFFESEVGIAFLHRLILAVHFVMTMVGAGSVRHVCTFLELSGLDAFAEAAMEANEK